MWQSIGCWKFSFSITEINDILKYNKIDNDYFKLIVIILDNISVLLYSWSNKCSLSEQQGKNIKTS